MTLKLQLQCMTENSLSIEVSIFLLIMFKIDKSNKYKDYYIKMNTLNFTHQSHSPLRVRGTMSTSRKTFGQQKTTKIFDISSEEGNGQGE